MKERMKERKNEQTNARSHERMNERMNFFPRTSVFSSLKTNLLAVYVETLSCYF